MESKEEVLEELFKLGVLEELIYKCVELVQTNGLIGGHRGYVDNSLNDIRNELFCEIEQKKKELLSCTAGLIHNTKKMRLE